VQRLSIVFGPYIAGFYWILLLRCGRGLNLVRGFLFDRVGLYAGTYKLRGYNAYRSL